MSRDGYYYVYIMASGHHGTLYVGVTGNLAMRAHQHREGMVSGFTKRYGVDRLVYYEVFGDPVSAIHREKRLKKYKREWKCNLIESMNRDWIDLYPTLQL
jgi:putative endonuclease